MAAGAPARLRRERGRATSLFGSSALFFNRDCSSSLLIGRELGQGLGTREQRETQAKDAHGRPENFTL